MKSWTIWSARLGIAGACFLVTGCGGSDVPDASNEGQAVAGSDADSGGGGAAGPAPAAVVSDEPKVAQADAPNKSEEAAAESPATPAPEAEPPAATPKAEQAPGNSNTAEMLAMATGPGGASPPPGGSPPADSSTAPGAPATPGSPAGPGGPGAGGPAVPAKPGALPGGGMGPGGAPIGGPGMMGPNAPGINNGRRSPGAMVMGGDQMAKMGGAMPGRPGAAGGPGGLAEGGAGVPGIPGGGGQVDSGPADPTTPEGAVRAFLNALRAKDADRLNESTALRAPTEAASSKNQELFRKISELALSDSELDELASKLEGYTIAGRNAMRSTGRIEVILQKPGENGAYFLRKITVRHEKKGWGVMDIAGAQEFKSMNGMPKRKR